MAQQQQQQQSSRLNRLLTLLDTGSTSATRLTAAKQIGEIAKQHPTELQALLKRVGHFLRSKSWETRVAAAHAIGSIAENVSHVTVRELVARAQKNIQRMGCTTLNLENVLTASGEKQPSPGLAFSRFDVHKVLESGRLLLASGGQEFDVSLDSTKTSVERLAHQKQNLRRRLGLDEFVDVNDMIRDEDLMMQRTPVGDSSIHNHVYQRQEVQQLVANMVPGVLPRTLSAREKNMLKRKAKFFVKDGSKEEAELEEPSNKRPKSVVNEQSQQQTDKLVLDSVLEEDGQDIFADGRWPFSRFVEALMHDIFDPVWEIRHGSIMALREILSSQAASAAVTAPETSSTFTANRVETKGQEAVVDTKLEPSQETKVEQKNELVSDVKKEEQKGGDKMERDAEKMELVFDGKSEAEEIVSDQPKTEEQEMENTNDRKDIAVKGELDLNQDVPEVKGVASTENDPKAACISKEVAAAQEAWRANSEFLQDCTIRLICIFSLDRFGDFVSDQVVAPVRETCAQVLGAVLKQMHSPLVHETFSILLQMQRRSEWEVRHGSLLGIKYLVAVRQEMIGELLPRVLPACIAGLEDPDDDVRSVAADALFPAARAIVTHASHLVKTILILLWDILLDLDDLSPSTNSVMHLLAELYSQPEALLPLNSTSSIDLNADMALDEQQQDLDDLSVLAPRLWPFMRHNISSVRYAAIRTLEQLLESGSTCWALRILDDMLRMVFQNLLMESNEEILQCSGRVWRLLIQCSHSHLQPSTLSFFPTWLKLASTAAGASLEASNMFSPTSLPKGSRSKVVAKLSASKLISRGESHSHGPEAQKHSDVVPKVVVGADGENSAVYMRIATTSALGVLAGNVPGSMLDLIFQALNQALHSPSGIQRQVASMVLISCFKEVRSFPVEKKAPVISAFRPLTSYLQVLLLQIEPSHPTPDSSLPYAELSRTYAKMRAEVAALVKHAEASNFGLPVDLQPVENMSVEAAIDAAMKFIPLEECNGAVSDEKTCSARDMMESARQRLLATAGYLKCVQVNLHGTVLALMASVVVWMGELPSKLNPIIQPLMGSVKREQEEVLQQCAGEALAEVIGHCVGRKPCPNDKLIKNLSTMACADQLETPLATEANSSWTFDDGDYSLKSSSTALRKMEVASIDDKAKVEGIITRRGAELALKALCQRFGDSLFEKLPRLWDCLTEVIKPSDPGHIHDAFLVEPVADPQALVNNLQLIRVTAPFLKNAMQSRILTLLPAIFGCVRHRHAAVRCGASRCITAMARTLKETIMTAVLAKAMPMLTDGTSMEARQGAGMLVTFLVEGMGMELVGYAPFLIVPLLGCMGDSNQVVRQSVTHSFAALVPLLPLARGVPQPEGISSLSNSDDARFLEQLLDNSRVDDYKLAFDLKTPLRRYQQEGINWLAFLKRFKLHGVLCDDMGLGKTLQASAIVASDMAERIAAGQGKESTLSLIVCPPTLVGHWIYEIEKFIPAELLKPLQYVGQPQDRLYLRNQFSAHSIIITSYDVLRKDIEHLSQIQWNFCILDEGHIIKSGKSKITLAVKRIQAEHRLILSGTPIQNNVLELWSLFDFLMPGFLGTERQFHGSYGKPLQAARDPKCSAKEAEAGVLAMEALHKQVMPFLLRRTKDEVLADLPPKIIQDRYCDLSPLQLKLYEKFAFSQAKKNVATMVEAYGGNADDRGNTSAPTHVFQALQYLRKVCSHPVLVLDGPLSENVNEENGSMDIHDIQNSPKLLALRDILEECGIGQCNGDNSTAGGQHRVLIFAQLKGFLDIIEKDLFQTHMKSVTYMRLDGSVDVSKRFEIVKAFNSDPTIDVLLLTTHVGGLGLNLTAADTVVFMEHDWNPMRDLQAMDRSHRLGQRRVVNVHRLIMRGTLEEKVMNLQRFKLSIANTVINADNASISSMDTGQLLDLFTFDGKKANVPGTSKDKEEEAAGSSGSKGGKGLKSMLSSLEDLWDQSLYHEEYNLGQFVSRLK
ncbi:TATA-binding protein-associated factor BTAF1 [Selaginella moellendorffii]|uniref:TATA-binding protein-associated factor BTAF1 n=1 Tax=Selaginella moellendorffii TaxID=88036 RepID=UPI000D1C8905|nr:TATA-binding protein-associated factor BTAF1 [Selaginella moellendorffii]|eukprot:XP_024523098.1 TATA-binding protein-associated factor BTAF1 [Selaginella moellendorffii]